MTSKEDSFRLVVFLFSFIYSGFERTVLSIALLIRAQFENLGELVKNTIFVA